MTDNIQPDWIRDKVALAAKARGLSAYALAKRTEGKVSIRQVQRYLAGSSSLTSELLQHVLDVLGLRVE